MTAGWSGPDFLGYTDLENTVSFDGPTETGVNEAIGLTGMVTAAWNLNLYSFPSNGPGSNLGAMFSNMGFFYNPPDHPFRHFKFRIEAEVVFTLDRAGNFNTYQIGENIGPFQILKLEAGSLNGNTFVPSSTLLDPLTLVTTAYLVPGAYRFKFKVDTEWDRSEAFGLGNTTVCQVIEAQNQPPVATDDYYGIDQLSALNQAAPGILVNDSDPNPGDSLSVSLVGGPTHASSFQLNADGSFTYIPTSYFVGEDSFTYRISDGIADSNVATVHITTTPPGAGGFITGGGNFYQAGTKRTFGFEAKAKPDGSVKGNLTFQDHGMGLDVKSSSTTWVYAPNQIDGYFAGTCQLNGQSGYSYFVEVHDLGEPGTSDSFSIWVLDPNQALVYSSCGVLSSGGNIQIHGH